MLEEDLTIGEGPIKEEDIVWDETTPCEYADTASGTLYNLCNIDEMQMAQFTELERRYIKKTKKMCIRIIHHYINDVFTDLLNQEMEE